MWGRLELTDIVFANIAGIRQNMASFMDIVPVVAGSEGEASRSVAEKNGFSYVEVENHPLGSKWNAALSLLRDRNVDGVVILGSDDLVNERYFHVLKELLDQGCLLAGLDTFFVLESQNGRLMEWMGYLPPRQGESIGAGRFLHRKLLELMKWHLWEDGLHEGLDKSMWGLLRGAAARNGLNFSPITINSRAEGIVLTDVKGSTQITGLETLALSSGSMRMIGTPRYFLEQAYGKYLAQRLVSLSPALAKMSSTSVPDQLVDTLAPFASSRDKKPSVYVLTPYLPNGVADMADQQFSALLATLRLQGHKVELWTENSQREFAFKLDSGMAGQVMRSLKEVMRNPPRVQRLIVKGGWSNTLVPLSVIKRLRRNCPEIKVTADLRFSDTEEARSLVAAADSVVPDISEIGDGGFWPLCVPERKIPFIGFAMREHAAVFMEHEAAIDEVDDLILACATDGAWQKAQMRIYLSFACETPAPAPQYGVYSCISGNMQIFYRIFKVCIIPPSCHNQGICAEILAAGTPLLCSADLGRKMNLGEEDGVVTFTSWKEALTLTRMLCAKRDVWEGLAKKAWKTGKRIVETSAKDYAALVPRE